MASDNYRRTITIVNGNYCRLQLSSTKTTVLDEDKLKYEWIIQ